MAVAFSLCAGCSKFSLINRAALREENAQLQKEADTQAQIKESAQKHDAVTLQRHNQAPKPAPVAQQNVGVADDSAVNQAPPKDSPRKISMGTHGGVFTISGRLNGVLTLDFILDSGAADVSIPADVASTLLRTQTIKQGDFLPGATYIMADGSRTRSQRFMIRQLEVGNVIVRNVPASVSSNRGDLLLGQSFLSRFPRWSIDNQSHKLILGRESE